MSAITKILYAAKTNPNAVVTRSTQATAEDFNEIKEVVNNLVDAVNPIIAEGLDFTPEDRANKVISISSASTDIQYASAKALYDALISLQDQTFVPYKILLSASADVATRISGGCAISLNGDAITDWTVTADSVYNMIITHTLAGRKIAFVNVFEIDGADERLIKPFEDAYAGIVSNGLAIKIEGLDTVALPLRIELIFD